MKKIAFSSGSWFREPGGTPPPRIYRSIYNFSTVLTQVVHSPYLYPVRSPCFIPSSCPFYTQSAVRSPQSMFYTDRYLALFSFERRYICFLFSREISSWKQTNINSLIEVIEISETLNAKSSEGRISFRFQQNVTRLWPTCGIAFTVFLPRFSRLFGLLSSRISQNNLLDLYLVQIRRCNLSFLAKAVTVGPTFF